MNFVMFALRVLVLMIAIAGAVYVYSLFLQVPIAIYASELVGPAGAKFFHWLILLSLGAILGATVPSLLDRFRK